MYLVLALVPLRAELSQLYRLFPFRTLTLGREFGFQIHSPHSVFYAFAFGQDWLATSTAERISLITSRGLGTPNTAVPATITFEPV